LHSSRSPCLLCSTQNHGLRGLQSGAPFATSAELAVLDVCLVNVDAAGAALATPLAYVEFFGQTLEPGSYYTGAAMGLTGTLFLSTYATTYGANGVISQVVVTDPEWTIYIGGALTTNAASKIVIIGVDESVIVFDPSTNDAANNLADNKVHFKVVGAATVGEASFMRGDLKSGGAITVAASATVGNLQAGGAIILGPLVSAGTLRADGALTVDVQASSGDIYDATKQSKTVNDDAILACNALLT
jgi:hypothetical protein